LKTGQWDWKKERSRPAERQWDLGKKRTSVKKKLTELTCGDKGGEEGKKVSIKKPKVKVQVGNSPSTNSGGHSGATVSEKVNTTEGARTRARTTTEFLQTIKGNLLGKKGTKKITSEKTRGQNPDLTRRGTGNKGAKKDGRTEIRKFQRNQLASLQGDRGCTTGAN